MLRIKRALFCAVSGFALTSLVFGARSALQADELHGWSSAGMGWLVLDNWSAQWRWQMGGLGALLALAVGWCFGAAPAAEQRAGLMGRSASLFGHPLIAVLLMLATRYGPGICAGVFAPKTAQDAPNVLLVVVDTWRADHTSFLGYERSTTPGLDRLATEGVVFEQAKAQTGWTKPSVATILTGLMPARHQAVSQPGRDGKRRGVNLPLRMHTLIEMLASQGWQTAMWSNNPNIIPERGFGQGAQDFASHRGRGNRSAGKDLGRAEYMLPAVERWLTRRRAGERPFCAYVHIMDPHLPYEAPAPFAGKFDQSGLDFQLGPAEQKAFLGGELLAKDVTPAMLTRLLDAYDEELAYVDEHLTKFIEGIRQQYPNTLIVLLGDHGEEFLEHGQFGHAHALYEELMHVPLVIWAPGLPAQRIAQQVRLLDVTPTILELCQLAGGFETEFQGQSLVLIIEGSEVRDRLIPMETGGEGDPNFNWRGLTDGRYKMLRRELDPAAYDGQVPFYGWESRQEAPYLMLFDLEADPAEKNDLFAADPERAQEMFAQFQAAGWYKSPLEMFATAEVGPEASASEIEDLGALGYSDSSEEEDQ